MDLQLPGMDGFSFIERFTEDMLPRCAQTRIHVLSASRHPEDRIRAEAHPHIRSYTSKPLRLEQLRQMLSLQPAGLMSASF